ncbi:EAL domain-containing protein [Alphaproteobacteria bacterium]|nr:EAL domain-containing protein [Alphaproteobacteria bacterium]
MNKTIVIALSTVLVGIGVGVDFLAPEWVPLPGWLLSITALIIIFVFKLNLRHNQIQEEFNELKDQLKALDREMIETRVELDTTQDKLNNNLENPEIASELRMLRSLMKQFTDKVNGHLDPEAAISQPSILEQHETKPNQEDQAITHEPILDYSDNELLKFLEKSVREDRVELYLQPIVRLPQRSQVFFECFSRIMDDKGNIIRPEQYLPVATSAGLAAAVDNLLLFKCVQLVRRTRRENPEIVFFCNISKSTLADIDFFTDFIDFMADNTNLSSSLVFEFSQETTLDKDYEIQNGLERLSKLGFRLSLDQLHQLNVDLPKLASQGFKFIKIDAHLLHEMARGDTPNLNMRALKGALDRVAMDLIVEKIENEEMLKDLLDLQIDFGQGYLFGAPKSATAANR